MYKRLFFLLILISINGCATTTIPPTDIETVESIVPPAFDNETKQFVEQTVPEVEGTLTVSPEPISDQPDDEIVEPVENNGIVFAKTSFEGVLKTSFVRLKFIDLAYPERIYELHIGEKVAQQPFSFNVKTVNPGYFYIELPVSKYQIISVSIPVGGTTATEDIDITFDVLPNQITYMGTLRMIGTKEKIKLGGVPVIRPGFEYDVAILNEFAEGEKAFHQRFPDVPGSFAIQLMKLQK